MVGPFLAHWHHDLRAADRHQLMGQFAHRKKSQQFYLLSDSKRVLGWKIFSLWLFSLCDQLDNVTKKLLGTIMFWKYRVLLHFITSSWKYSLILNWYVVLISSGVHPIKNSSYFLYSANSLCKPTKANVIYILCTRSQRENVGNSPTLTDTVSPTDRSSHFLHASQYVLPNLLGWEAEHLRWMGCFLHHNWLIKVIQKGHRLTDC